MPSVAHKKINIMGTLNQQTGAGTEHFQFGLADASGISPHDLAVLVDNYCAAHWDDTGLGLSINANYTSTRVEAISAGGLVTDSYLSSLHSPVSGANATMSVTLVCFAVSLETGMTDSRGTKIRGRIYPPAQPADVIGASCGVADLPSYNTAWAGFITGLNTAGAVVSVASSTSVGLTPVTGTSCDTRMDTQRRRRDNVVATRSSVHAV